MKAIWMQLLAAIFFCVACSNVLITDEEVARLELLEIILRANDQEVPYVMDVIQSHPDKELSMDMQAWIESGKLGINYEPEFPDNFPGRVGLRDVNGELLPGLGIGSSFFAFSVKGQFAVLSHEYVHIKEIIEGIANLDWYPDQHTEETVRDRLEEETRAYISQCEIARRLDTTDSFGICVIYQNEGELALRLQIINNLVKDMRFLPFKEILISQAEEHARN